jgi:hypothetical protein
VILKCPRNLPSRVFKGAGVSFLHEVENRTNPTTKKVKAKIDFNVFMEVVFIV